MAITPRLHVGAPSQFEPVPADATATDQDPTFVPDGKTLYFTRAPSAQVHVILVTHRSNGKWSAPRVASFSGKWRDLEEVLSPDGNTMIFASNRPVKKGGKPLDGFYYNKRRPARGGNLWEVHRIDGKWSAPERLPDAVNANTSVFSPALASDGALFFMRAAGPKKSFQIFVSHLDRTGIYSSASLAPFNDDRYSNFDPTVSADGLVVVFLSNRPPSASQAADLFITRYRAGHWTTPRDLGPAMAGAIEVTGSPGEPRLSPDAKTLYYTASKGQAPGRMWRVDLIH